MKHEENSTDICSVTALPGRLCQWWQWRYCTEATAAILVFRQLEARAIRQGESAEACLASHQWTEKQLANRCCWKAIHIDALGIWFQKIKLLRRQEL